MLEQNKNMKIQKIKNYLKTFQDTTIFRCKDFTQLCYGAPVMRMVLQSSHC